MTTREVGAIVSGSVVGIMIGAAILFTNADQSLGASLNFVSFRSLMNSPVLPRSDVLRRTPSSSELQPVAVPTVDAATPSTSAPVEVAVSPDCAVAQDIGDSFLAAISRFVPANLRNIEMRGQLQQSVAGITQKYCPPAAAHGAAAEPTAQAVKVDNHCEQYGDSTTRHFVCMAEQESGRVYPAK